MWDSLRLAGKVILAVILFAWIGLAGSLPNWKRKHGIWYKARADDTAEAINAQAKEKGDY